MTTIDKKDYYKVGAELLNANIEFVLPHSRHEGYFLFLLEQLAHACFQKYEKEFSKEFAKRVEHLIEDRRINFGKISLTIPQKAIQDISSAQYLFSLCELKVWDGLCCSPHDINTKVY